MLRTVAPKEAGIVIAIVVLAAALGFGLPHLVPTVRAGENWLQDFRFGALARPEPQNTDVVVVAINEETMATLPYRSPVDRGFLARLLQALAAAAPKAIGIDILFDQPTEPEKDAALRRTLLGLPVPVTVAWAGVGDTLTEAQAAHLDRFTDGIGRGLVNLVKDRADGTVRRVFAGRRVAGAWRPGMTAALAEAVGVPPPDGDVAIAYRHGPGPDTPAFKIFGAHTAALLPKAWFKDKVVLIGADLPLIDRHRTPFAAALGVSAGDLPGVVIFAHAVAQHMDGRKWPQAGTTAVVVLLVLAAGVGMVVAMLDLPLAAKAPLYVAVLAALWGGGFALYQVANLMIPLLTPSIAFVAGAGGGVAYFGRRDRAQKEFIRGAFQRYVSPAIVDELTRRPGQLTLGGERRELTYLFTDLADFTAFTERTDPAVLVPLLNEYLEGMCAILFEHGATIDKIVGDAVVGFFNAPVDQPDHARRAVAAALALDAFGRKFVADKTALGLDVGMTRIGVHSGSAVIGNFGGDQFFDYTAHGDMVNTAARLESVNKHLGTRVCISGVTAAASPETPFRPVGTLVLKGKTEGLDIFEPLADGAADSEAVAAYRDAFQRMAGNDPAAADGFRRVLELDPGDGLAKMHLGRLESGETGATIVMDKK